MVYHSIVKIFAGGSNIFQTCCSYSCSYKVSAEGEQLDAKIANFDADFFERVSISNQINIEFQNPILLILISCKYTKFVVQCFVTLSRIITLAEYP